ncbi:4Fe-4S dicluster domain-containing protein [Acidobacteriota bacterium]
MKRRTYLSSLFKGIAVAAGAASVVKPHQANAEKPSAPSSEGISCLVDTTLCIGCRKCEEACNKANSLPAPEKSFRDKSVFLSPRRPNADAFTVVNRYPGSPTPYKAHLKETFVKDQCFHCLDPACVSACIVGALMKSPQGPVLYDADKCIGCRYCMVACPFQIPAYEYDEAVAPQVRKCSFCIQRLEEGKIPACAAACPNEAILFGKRSELLQLAHERIRENPCCYVDHVYGEHEAGGTSWLYLAGQPFEKLGFLPIGDCALPRLTEAIQHGIFRYGLPPVALYGALGGVMWIVNRKRTIASSGQGSKKKKDTKEGSAS